MLIVFGAFCFTYVKYEINILQPATVPVFAKPESIASQMIYVSTREADTFLHPIELYRLE